MKDNLDDDLSKSGEINDHYNYNKKYYFTELTSSQLSTGPEFNMSCLIDSKRTVNNEGEFSEKFSQVSSVSSTTSTSTLRKKPEPPNWLGEFAQEFYEENQKFMDSLNAIYCSINANLNNASANNVFISSEHSRDFHSTLASSPYPDSLRRLSCPSVLSVNSKLISQCYDSRVLRKSSVGNWNALKSDCLVDNWRYDDTNYVPVNKECYVANMAMEDDIGNNSKHLNPNANDFSPNLNKKYHHSISENFVAMVKKEHDQLASNDICLLMARKKVADQNMKKVNNSGLDRTINKIDKGACFIFDESYFDEKEKSSKFVQKFDEQQLVDQLATAVDNIDQRDFYQSKDSSTDNGVNCLTGQPVYLFFSMHFCTNGRSFLFS